MHNCVCMIQNYRCKNSKDVETAAETLITGSGLINVLQNTGRTIPKQTVTYQQNSSEDYDSYMEQKK